MGFLTSLFGGEGTSWWGVAFALVFVLVLIIAGLWLLKLLFNASGSVGRDRNRRLAIIDSLSVDSKRSLVLVRRDDVEHLLVLGGANDVLVESGIAVAEAGAQRPARRPQQAQPDAGEQAPSSNQVRDPRPQDDSANRLGLSGLLRRYGNEPPQRVEPVDDTGRQAAGGNAAATAGSGQRPVDRLRTMQRQNPEEPQSRPLRHTGLLRTAPADEQEIPGETENPHPRGADSANNGAGGVDAEAEASIEEGAESDHAGAGEDQQHAGSEKSERQK